LTHYLHSGSLDSPASSSRLLDASFARIFEAIGDLGLRLRLPFLFVALCWTLSAKNSRIFSRSYAVLGFSAEQNIAEALKEVRLALLEADVNFKRSSRILSSEFAKRQLGRKSSRA